MKRMACDRSPAEDRFWLRGHGRILLVFMAFAASACDGPQSMLQPAGPSAHAISQVWWWMLGVATLVFAGVMALWLLGMRSGRGAPSAGSDEPGSTGRRWIIFGGVLLPTTAIVALLVFGSPAGLHHLPLPVRAGAPEPLVVEVTGHRWWWEVHYPATGLRLRNELRMPVGRPLDVRTTGADVIHSFWVPRLGGKLDAIPGRTLTMRLQADEAGEYRSQCAEFCGVGHAHMVMTVHAMEAAAFEAWLQSAQTDKAATAGDKP
jgi:cytochrome c oxidase subunit 2